jgi:hypothetical protein
MGNLGYMHTIVWTRGHLRPLGCKMEVHGSLVKMSLRSGQTATMAGLVLPDSQGQRLQRQGFPFAGAFGDETADHAETPLSKT